MADSSDFWHYKPDVVGASVNLNNPIFAQQAQYRSMQDAMQNAIATGMATGTAMSTDTSTPDVYAPQPTTSVLAPAMGLPSTFEPADSTEDFTPSEESPIPSSETPVGAKNAQNSYQIGKQRRNDLMDAYKAVQSFYEPMGGRAIAGSENIRVKSDIYGRPYTTVRVSPTESTDIYGRTTTAGKGMPKETIDFGINRPPAGLVGGTGESTFGGGLHSWEAPSVNPYTATSSNLRKKGPSGAGTSFSDLITQF